MEATTPMALFKGYAVPLAAIPALAVLIGTAIFGVNLGPFGVVRVPIATAITQAVVTYVLSLVGTYALGLIVNALAPTFGGTSSTTQALKVAVYGSTAGWVAGVFAIFPALSILGILGIYSLYLFYLGIPILMKAPQERALMYTVACIVVAIVVYVVIGVITSALVPAPTTPLGF
jgi:Yip1-like protein